MNANTEYELFTREVYRQLSAYHQTGFTKVQHNIKLKGRSGCEHQIDVYWEYKKDGITHRVAIECKNYNKRVSKEKVSAFYGIISDLDDVKGIMVSKKGFQKGAKQFAEHYGISLKELREPEGEETILGIINVGFHTERKWPLYKVDKKWATEHNIDVPDGFIHLQPVDDKLRNSKGIIITSLRTVEDGSTFEDAYLHTISLGAVKIIEVKYDYTNEDLQQNMYIDAEGFVKAILKDAFNDTTDFMVMR